MTKNPRRGRQAENFTTNVPKILDLKSFSEQIVSENWHWVPLKGAKKDPLEWNKDFKIKLAKWLWHVTVKFRLTPNLTTPTQSNNLKTELRPRKLSPCHSKLRENSIVFSKGIVRY